MMTPDSDVADCENQWFDAGPAELLPHVLALMVISVVLVTMSVRSFKKVSM